MTDMDEDGLVFEADWLKGLQATLAEWTAAEDAIAYDQPPPDDPE